MASPVKDAGLKHIAGGFTEVVERGRGWLRSRIPGTERYAWSSQGGSHGWHFGPEPFDEAHEVDTAWVNTDPILDAPWQKKMVLADYNAYAFQEPTLGFNQGQLIEYRKDGGVINFQPTQLQWTNDLGQISPIADPQAVSATITDDELKWIGAYGSGIDFRWQTQPAKLAKYVDVANLAQLGAPPQFIIDGGNPVLRVELLFQKSAGLEIWVDGVLWNEKANNPKTTLDDVEFRSGGVPIWYFKAPLSWDATGESVKPSMCLRATVQSLFVDILTPWSWIESAVFPIVIDATLTLQPDAAAGVDTMVSESNNTYIDYGTNPQMWAQETTVGGDRRRALIKFDLSSLPVAPTYNTITLSLWTANVADGVQTIKVYRILDANNGWTEALATWDHAVEDTVEWAGGSNGCGVSGTDYTATEIASQNRSGGAPPSEEVLSLNATEFETMRGSNNGMIVIQIPDKKFRDYVKFYTSDHTTSGNRPKLYVDYTPVAAGTEVVVPLATLVVTAYPPTVVAIAHINIEIPETGLLATAYAPTVFASDLIEIEIPASALGATPYAPSVSITQHVNVEVPFAGAVIATYVPVAEVTAHIDIEIPAALLQATTYAPSMAAGESIDVEIPSVAVVVVGYAPGCAVSDHIDIEIPNAVVAIAGNAPGIAATSHISIEVPATPIQIAAYAPTAAFTAHINVEIPAAAIQTATYAPEIGEGESIEVVVPASGLVVTGYSPLVEAVANIEVVVPAASLIVTGYVPGIEAGANVDVEIPVTAITIICYAVIVGATSGLDIEIPLALVGVDTYAPIVDATAYVDVVIPPAVIGIVGFAPSAGAPVEIDVPAASIAISPFAPEITASEHVYLEIPTGELVVTCYQPEAEVSIFSKVVPTATLGVSAFAPGVTVTEIIFTCVALTLEERSLDFMLHNRATWFTLEEETHELTLEKR